MSYLSSFDELEKEIEKLQNEFYTENGGKNVFLKKAQKYECANQIANKIPIKVLLESSCYVLNEINYVFIDYKKFKTFLNPNNYNDVIDHIIEKLEHIKQKSGGINVLLDLDGFTISAAERYKSLIQQFCYRCFQNGRGYTAILQNFTIYNCPAILDALKTIFLPLVDDLAKSKIKTIPKPDSKPYSDMVEKCIGTIPER
jgi:hypothetical protein